MNYNVIELYYIVSLHQTTTGVKGGTESAQLYYIVSLHQTTTYLGGFDSNIRCIISFLYIKPQQLTRGLIDELVVLYRFSTSNHNRGHRIKLKM